MMSLRCRTATPATTSFPASSPWRRTAVCSTPSRETETAEAKATAARLESLLVKIHASCGADGRLYGSITSKEIAERLEKDHGISVDKRKIQLSDPIRAYGQYDLDVKLYTDVAGKIHVLVCN